MKTYRVTRKITIAHYHIVQAETKKEAIEIAADYGEKTNQGCSYISDSAKAEIRPKFENKYREQQQ